MSKTPHDDFLDYLLHEKRYSPHTCTAYSTDLTEFRDYLATQYQLDSLLEPNFQIVRSWVAALMDSGISPRTINRKISSLRAFYRFQMREGKLRVNPMLKIQGPKTKKRLPVFVDENSMEVLHGKGMIEESEDDLYSGNLVRLIIEILYGTGMRLAELIDLQTEDVNLSSGTVKVLGKRNKERIIPITAELKGLISKYMQKREAIFNHSPNENARFCCFRRMEKNYPDRLFTTRSNSTLVW